MTNWQDALFTPRRVAVVGASASAGKAGALFLRNLTAVEAGFAGEVVAIHPSAREILGCPAYPSLKTVPARVDLAIIVTPPTAVPDIIADCGAAGVPVAIVISFSPAVRRGETLAPGSWRRKPARPVGRGWR